MEINKQKKAYWRDIFFQASGNTVGQVIGILGIPILSRVYSPEDFAHQAIFVQIVIFLAAFITLRLEFLIPLLKNKNESLDLTSFILKIGFYLFVLFTLVFYLFDAFSVLDRFNLKFKNYYYWAPLTAFFVSISLAFQYEVQRLEFFKISAIAEIYSKLSYVSFGLIASFFLGKTGLILTTFFSTLGKIFSLRKYINIFNNKKISVFKLSKEFKKMSLGMVFSNSILTLSTLLPLIYIGSKYGENSLGQFSLAATTIFLPSGLIGAAVGNVFYQRAAKLWNVKNSTELKKLWADTLFKLLLVAIPIYTILFFISPWAYPFFFGEQWMEAGQLARLLTFSAFFSFLAAPLDRLSLVLGISYYLPVIHIIRFLFLCLLVFHVATDLNAINEFMVLFVLIMSFVYFVDIFMCRFILYVKSK